MKKKNTKKNCLADEYPELCLEWSPKNTISPDSIAPGSGKKVLWVCEQGHEWIAAIYNRVYGATGCPYCAGRKAVAGENDLATLFPLLVREWDEDANGGLRPQDVTPGSGKKIAWTCEEGHKWIARVSDRVNGRGCPFCSGRKPIPGKTDLKTVFPKLAMEWDKDANGALTPRDVSPHSNKHVCWKCSNGHRWEARICDRADGSSCPYCAGKLPIKGKTDLKTVMPALAAEWSEKNGDLTPEDVTAGSNKKVFWNCEAGHVWEASIKNRAAGTKCPYCTGKLPIKGLTDLKSVYPELAKQWDFEKNNGITPEDVTPFSRKKVSWICPNGHRWTATISSRARGNGCPYCSGRLAVVGKTDLATLSPNLLKEWDYELNKGLSPNNITRHSNKKIHWICPEGHRWAATVDSRSRGEGCPICAGRIYQKIQ